FDRIPRPLGALLVGGQLSFVLGLGGGLGAGAHCWAPEAGKVRTTWPRPVVASPPICSKPSAAVVADSATWPASSWMAGPPSLLLRTRVLLANSKPSRMDSGGRVFGDSLRSGRDLGGKIEERERDAGLAEAFAGANSFILLDVGDGPGARQPRQAQQALGGGERQRASDIGEGVLGAAGGEADQLGIGEADRAGVELVRAALALGSEDGLELRFVPDGAVQDVMPQRALDAASGEAREMAVALALDGVVHNAQGGARAHMDRGDAMEEDGAGFGEHDGS